MCTGTRMVRPLSATARCTACLIHHVAYVENLQPRSGSNFSTARIRPTLPSWIRSSKGSPIPLYLLATLTTSLRFFSTSFLRALSSPALALLLRSISSLCVRRFPLSMRAKYPGMRSGVSAGRSLRRPLVVLMVSIKRLLLQYNPYTSPKSRTRPPQTHRNAPRGRRPSLLEVVWEREYRLFLGSCQTSSLHISERLSRSLPLSLRHHRLQVSGSGFRGPLTAADGTCPDPVRAIGSIVSGDG